MDRVATLDYYIPPAYIGYNFHFQSSKRAEDPRWRWTVILSSLADLEPSVRTRKGVFCENINIFLFVAPTRFEVKKWNAVALWAWDIVVDNCAICRSPHTPFKRNVTGNEKPF